MARPKKIAIVHENGTRGEVLPEALPGWERNGWTAVDDGDDADEHQELVDDDTDPDETGDNKE